jgi:hypothetical protein
MTMMKGERIESVALSGAEQKDSQRGRGRSLTQCWRKRWHMLVSIAAA